MTRSYIRVSNRPMDAIEQRLQFILENAHRPESWFEFPLTMKDQLFLSGLDREIGLSVNHILDSAMCTDYELIIPDDMRKRVLELVAIQKKIQEILPSAHKIISN